MKTKTIRQHANFSATPKEVYEALMDSKTHAKFTRAKARISRRIGGRVSAFDGWIEATNVKLVPGKLIVQKWRGADWPEGHYSVAKFSFAKSGKGTRLTFTQTSVPEEVYKDISEGWVDYYWEKMEKMFRSSQK